MKGKLFLILNIILISLFLIFILLRFEIIGSSMVNMSFRHSDKEINNKFQKNAVQPEINYHEYGNYKIRYLSIIGRPELPYVVFIHGAPGSLSDYLRYFKDERLYAQLNLISIDRLGYGRSGFGKAETSLEIQAESIHTLVKELCINDRVILVGHSYGGPIAIKMAMEYRDSYEGILLLAPALDPANEKEIILSKIPKFQPMRWLTPPSLKVASDEKNSHVEELKKLLANYKNIEIPVCHIHGTSDSLVPYANLDFSKKNITSKFLEAIPLENADHFLPWSHYELIVEKILEMTIDQSSTSH